MNTVKIINIGDELLLGQVVNTNASTMGRMLTEAGFEVACVEVVGDRRDDITRALGDHERYDVVLITGGLGPTKDDITKKLLCEYFGSELVDETFSGNMELDAARLSYETMRGAER